jgi:hypothetical protein
VQAPVVEVVPLVASAAPVIVGGGIVGAVVGVLGLLVEGAGLGVLDERLGVEVGSLLSVEDGTHLHSEGMSEGVAALQCPWHGLISARTIIAAKKCKPAPTPRPAPTVVSQSAGLALRLAHRHSMQEGRSRGAFLSRALIRTEGEAYSPCR